MMLYVTIAAAKSAAWLSRLFGRGNGDALPGLVAERLDPLLMHKLVPHIPGGVILVTGTNGKTTATKQIVAILRAAGEEVLTNDTGSNLRRGIVSAFVRGFTLRGTSTATIAVFEVDEASLRRVASELKPNRIVVLNLFRDQLDRYGELDTTAAMLSEGIAQTNAQLYLNADDPLVANLGRYAENRPVTYFGIEGTLPANTPAMMTPSDSERCPRCHAQLQFEITYYSHIGHYRCPTGDYIRPLPTISASGLGQLDTHGSRFKLNLEHTAHTLVYPLPGIYNLYNALAAAAVTHDLVSPEQLIQALSSSEAAFGRVERFKLNERIICLLLIKNPAGFSQVLQTFIAGRGNVRALMVINDLHADGRDVSWLWDVAVEELAVSARPQLGVSGLRAYDMALRLKYAGLTCWIEADLERSITKLIDGSAEGEELYILPTYTAMNDIRKVLLKLTQSKPS